jgi:hypothetical protein
MHYVLFFSRFASTYIADTTYLPFRAKVVWKIQKKKGVGVHEMLMLQQRGAHWGGQWRGPRRLHRRQALEKKFPMAAFIS